MKYIKYEILSGEDNMRIDSELLEQSIANNSDETIFRLYGWSPKCISLGRNQKGINAGGNKKGIDVVRRVTGGRALLHDDEITYSCVIPVSKIPDGESVIASYKYISGYLIRFFKTLGIELDFGGGSSRGKSGGKSGGNAAPSTKFDYCMLISTGADVCCKGKKIIGSAQFRKNGYILQHGSVLFSYDKELLENLFHEEVSNDKITTVNEILPEMTKEEFVKRFEDFISKETL